MINVFIKKIEQINEKEAQAIISSLSENAKKRLNKKRNKDLFLASLCALALLSDLQRADLDYHDSGVPFFKTLDADISISHSKNYVTVAISNSRDNHEGIDVEDDMIKSPSNRFLTESEQNALENGTPYLEIWTKKEALFKFLKNDSTPFINLDTTFPEKHKARFTTIQIENATFSVCSHPNTKIEIIQK